MRQKRKTNKQIQLEYFNVESKIVWQASINSNEWDYDDSKFTICRLRSAQTINLWMFRQKPLQLSGWTAKWKTK